MGNSGQTLHIHNRTNRFIHFMKTGIKTSDIFAIPLPLNMKKKEKYKSKLSGTVSLCIIGIFVFIAVYTSLEYYYGGSG